MYSSLSFLDLIVEYSVSNRTQMVLLREQRMTAGSQIYPYYTIKMSDNNPFCQSVLSSDGNGKCKICPLQISTFGRQTCILFRNISYVFEGYTSFCLLLSSYLSYWKFKNNLKNNKHLNNKWIKKNWTIDMFRILFFVYGLCRIKVYV